MTTSTKPYFIRAVHQWCTDNGQTPYLVVQVDASVNVPMEFVKNNEIVLNIGYNATKNLQINNDFLTFSARFGGVGRDIWVPVGNVLSIFARESGEGMGFEYEPPVEGAETLAATPADAPAETAEMAKPAASRSHLRVVK